MGGKRRAQTAGNAQGKADAAEPQGGKRQTLGLSVGGGAGSAETRSCGQEESGSILAPVTMSLSMRCDPRALTGRRGALEAAVEAAVRKVVSEFGGWGGRVEWTRVGPSEDTLQRVLPLVLERVGPEWAAQLCQVCKPPPSFPPDLDAPLPPLPLTARPAHVLCWLG
jgi:hypothetical protein